MASNNSETDYNSDESTGSCEGNTDPTIYFKNLVLSKWMEFVVDSSDPSLCHSWPVLLVLRIRFLCFVESATGGPRVLLLSLKCWSVSALVCYCLGFCCPLWVLGSGDIVLSAGLANHGHIFVRWSCFNFIASIYNIIS
ncbi:hypothetical protein Bca4012_009886 [Brassica carinata]